MSLDAPMRLTRSRSRSQTRPTASQSITITTTSTTVTPERKRPANGYTAEEEDQASKFLRIDEEDEDVHMQTSEEAAEQSSKKRSRSRSAAKATTSKKQKEQPPQSSAQAAPAVHMLGTVAPTPQPPTLTLGSGPTATSSTASRASLQAPSRNSSSGSSSASTTQRSRSHSNARRSAGSAYISPELLGGEGAATFSPATSTSSTASLQPPATTSAQRRPSVPNLPSQSRKSTSSSSSSLSSAADAGTSEFRLQLTLERLSQLKRQLTGVKGAAQLLDLLKQVEDVTDKSGRRTASVRQLSAVHNQLLSAMRQSAEETAGITFSVSVIAARLLDDRIVPRSVASVVSSRALLSQSLPALITANLPMSHKLLTINPAAVHQRDAEGFTALHYAVLSHDQPLVAYLCEHGANPAAQNNSRSSPLTLARVNSLDTSAMLRHPAACCSRVEGGTSELRQDFFNCHTCGLTGHKGCCDVCSLRCHKGHVLQQVTAAENMCNEGFCDCPDTGACQASDDSQAKQTSSTVDEAAAVLSSEEDGGFSTSKDTISPASARSMLRVMEDAVVRTAELMQADGAGEEVDAREAEAAADEERITWNDVWQASALTAVLTLSFYAIFGGAPDIVQSATPAVHWLQDQWQLLTAAIAAVANANTKH